MVTDDDLKAAEAALHKAEESVREARINLDGLRVRRSEELWGVKVGSRIKYERRRGTFVEGVVSSVRPSASKSKPWVNARLFKKDGTPGERETCVYSDWEMISP